MCACTSKLFDCFYLTFVKILILKFDITNQNSDYYDLAYFHGRRNSFIFDLEFSPVIYLTSSILLFIFILKILFMFHMSTE